MTLICDKTVIVIKYIIKIDITFNLLSWMIFLILDIINKLFGKKHKSIYYFLFVY